MIFRWPWVSRRAYDDLRARCTWLEGRVEFLEDRQDRRQRFEAGMAETPRAPRPVILPMPEELAEYIRGLGNASMQKFQRDECYKAVARGTSWDEIVKQMLPQPEEQGGEQAASADR